MLPAEFTQRLAEIYPSALAQQIIATMAAPKSIAVWENPLRDGSGRVSALCAELELPAPQPVADGLAGCYELSGEHRDRVMHHAAITSGAIYPLNPSSLLAALALDVQPGHEVLDLAAAPGGKSLVLAACLTPQGSPTGRLALVEPVKPRFHRLRANMQRCGVDTAHYYQRDGRGVGRAVPERFDRVLLDAPCSSEARFRAQDPATMIHWSLRKVRECARKQKSLLKSAYAALKPGGTLVYCTCSFAPEENERIVAGLLAREPGAALQGVSLPAAVRQRASQGLDVWGKKSFGCSAALRVLPDHLWDGFFLAKIIKTESSAE